jgi:hypothetical protein
MHQIQNSWFCGIGFEMVLWFWYWFCYGFAGFGIGFDLVFASFGIGFDIVLVLILVLGLVFEIEQGTSLWNK